MRYPAQIIPIKRENKTLSTDVLFYLPPEDESPLKMHAGYSRAVVTIVDKSQSVTQTPKFNLPAIEIPYLHQKVKTMMLIAENTPTAVATQTEEVKSIAYTQKLFDKTFKGKTPAEVLIASPEKKDDLLKVREWLDLNKDRYRTNVAQITAIDEAIKLLEAGKLEIASAPVVQNTTRVVYDSGRKFLESEKKKDDKTFCYSAKITYTMGNDYPFKIFIENYYAPVVKDENGKCNIVSSAAIDFKQSTMYLTEMEMFILTDRMSKTLIMFEQDNFHEQFKKAKDNDLRYQPRE